MLRSFSSGEEICHNTMDEPPPKRLIVDWCCHSLGNFTILLIEQCEKPLPKQNILLPWIHIQASISDYITNNYSES